MGGGKRRDDNFAQMIEVACRYDKPVRIGVNWGSLDHELMARKMDENNQRAVPWEAQAVMRDALVVRHQQCAARGRAGPAPRCHHPVLQGQPCAGPDRRLS